MDPPSSRSSDDVFSTPPEQPHPHRSRIYFPEGPNPSRRRPYSAEGPSAHMQLGPPVRRGSPLNPQRVPGQDRRRLSSNDGLNPTSESLFRTRRSPLLIPMDDNLPQNIRVVPELDGVVNDVSMFSDEYDLSHEDPRILQDVQRALKVKARREAKMKATPSSDHHALPLTYVSSSSKQATSPGRQPYSPLASPTPLSPFSSPLRKTSTSTGSDIDFSPSTRRPQVQMSQHPVPSSLDNGLTLDWGSSAFVEEKADRKWSLSVRRKDKPPPLELMQDQQEKNHRERLSRLRASASSQTLRKAEMTSDQLQRRYCLIEQSLGGDSDFLNLAMISRWYGSQDEARQQEIEKAEPHTWLKHLPRKSRRLSRWQLSARIMEEFVAAQATPPQQEPRHMEPIPEDRSLQEVSRPLTREQSPEHTRVSLDGKLRSPRDSFDVESRRSAESALSSIVSGSSNPVVSSLPSIKHHSRSRTRTPSHLETTGNGAEDAWRTPTTIDTSPDQPPNRRTPLHSENGDMRKKAVIDLGENLPKLVLPVSDGEGPKDDLDSKPSPPPRPKLRSSVGSLAVNRRLMSSPLSRYMPPPPALHEDPRKEIEHEEVLRRVYEQKATLLADTITHNQRIRQLLNRISISVKEYDAVQRTATNVLGKKYQVLPKELVESFGHDPAAVTGPTRRLRGWRAVEDIHQRLLRQRQVFATFIALESHRTSDCGSFLDDKVSSLMRSLSALEGRKEELAEMTKKVEGVLEDVQNAYKGAKADYDKTVPLISALYPELSQAVALEESYKDQYQQIWEFGMDALTLLLDTVTPFWRNYGKTIGEDIRDFLIIPLYRNEFTGEAKRYSINTLPKRSLRHWLGLVSFLLASILLTTLQARVAISSTIHSRLKWIPVEGMRYTALPFFWIGILIQWCVVLVECGIVFMGMGIIAWWMGWSVNLLT